jgi:small GTP-binding protein
MVSSIKLLLLGDSGVGKTGLIMRYCDNTFPMSFASTIGVDIKIKLINIKGEKVKLQIWDTAGQERFKTLTTNVYRGVHGLMLVYDISDEFSFSNVRNWMMHLDKHTDKWTVRILVGNKVDTTTRVFIFEYIIYCICSTLCY